MQRGDPSGQNAVGLLRHLPVVAAQPRLEVGDGNPQLVGRQRAAEHAVGVALDQHPVGADLGQRLGRPDDDGAELQRRRRRADLQVRERGRQTQLLEEDRVHLIRVVLSRVDDGQRRLPPHQRVHHGGDLDELRSGADDECDHVPTCLPGWPAPAEAVRSRTGSAPARAPASSSLRRAASRLALCISPVELSAALAHLRQLGGGSGQRHLHRVRQPHDIAGRDQPPADVVLHQLGDPGDPGGDDRTVHGEGLHDDDRQPLGEAGHHQRAGLEQERSHPLVVDPARSRARSLPAPGA